VRPGGGWSAGDALRGPASVRLIASYRIAICG